jgi:hypothetical protein
MTNISSATAQRDFRAPDFGADSDSLGADSDLLSLGADWDSLSLMVQDHSDARDT